MPYAFALLLLLVILLFSLSSISQSYATAQQAQAAIEASRAAQIASTGNLVTLVTAALVIVAALAAVIVIAWLLLRAKPQPNRQWVSGPNANWGQIAPPQASALLPAMLTMMLYQTMKSQPPQETEPFWLLNEPANDDPAFPDNLWEL